MSEAMNQDNLGTHPQISIGMPVFNGEPFIREAIDSLLAQSFTYFELIISDNGSTDGTETICREYAACDVRIRYVRQPENRGVLFNFQFVLNEARGDHFMWAAADDVWDSRWIEVLLPVSDVHQCLAYGFVQTIDVNSKKTKHPANNRKFDFTGTRFARKIRYFAEPGVLGKANPIYGIFPIQKLRELDLSILSAEPSGSDMIFLYKLLDNIEIMHGGRVFLYKRIHDGCTVASVNQKNDKRNFISILLDLIKNIMFGPMLHQYIKQSSAIQSASLFAAYPFCFVYNATYILQQYVALLIQIFIKQSNHGGNE